METGKVHFLSLWNIKAVNLGSFFFGFSNIGSVRWKGWMLFCSVLFKLAQQYYSLFKGFLPCVTATISDYLWLCSNKQNSTSKYATDILIR